MSIDPASPDSNLRRDKPVELPPVEPPSAKFIIQLFVIPAAIVIVLVVAYLAFVQLPFGRLANGGRDVMDYVRSIRSNNEHRRWRSAQELANLINNDARLAQDRRLLGELTVLLSDELRKPDKEAPELPVYLATAVGRFQTMKADPVDGRSVDPIAVLASGLAPEQPVPVRVASARSLLWQAERLGGDLGNPEAVRALCAASEADDPDVRSTAAVALGRLGDEESLHALRKRIDDEAPAVRYNVGVALVRRGDPSAAHTLKEMLSPADLAQTMKRNSPSETETAIEGVELEALWALQAAPASGLEVLAGPVRSEIQALADSGPQNIRVEARSVLKKLPSAK